MNPYLKKVGELSRNQVILFSAIASVVYYFYFFNDGAKIKQNIKKEREERDVQLQLEKERLKAEAEAELTRKQYNSVLEQLGILQDQLPSEFDLPEIIRVIDDLAGKNQVLLKVKEPKPRIKSESVERLPISLSIEGSFSAVGQFFFDLLSLPRIFRILQVEVDSAFSARNVTSSLLQVRVDLETYRLLVQQTSDERKPAEKTK